MIDLDSGPATVRALGDPRSSEESKPLRGVTVGWAAGPAGMLKRRLYGVLKRNFCLT